MCCLDSGSLPFMNLDQPVWLLGGSVWREPYAHGHHSPSGKACTLACEGLQTCPRSTAADGRFWDSTPDASFCLHSFHCTTLLLNNESLDGVNVVLKNALPWYSALRFVKCFHFYLI